MAKMTLPAIATTYGLLAAALVSLWLNPIRFNAIAVPPWSVLFGAACVSGLMTGLVTVPAVLVLIGFAVLCYVAQTCRTGAVKAMLFLAVGVIALALALHRFGGFVNPALVANMQLGANAPPFTHRLNFDTGAAGLILFAFFCVPARTAQAWRDVARQTPVILGTAILVLALGLAHGFVGIDLKFPAYTLVFLACNLLFTCITEEAFFRGFMQEQLAAAMQRWAAGPYIALGIAAVLFGIAHARGGPVFIGLATVAGLGYGYAYLRSKRIEAAILAHITLNGLHFAAFTYPHALPGPA